MTFTSKQVFEFLKALPLLRFAIMLGAGIVASVNAALAMALLGFNWGWISKHPSVAIEQMHGITYLGLAWIAVNAVVVVTIAWGKVGKLSANIAGNQLDLDFDDKGE